MIRFTMPDSNMPKSKRIELLNEQFQSFLTSDVLKEYLGILDITSTEADAILQDLETYNMRKGADGQIRESQVVPLNEILEKNREVLFPLYKSFGLITINKTSLDYDHIALLGGSANSNFDKTLASKRLLSDKVKDVSALSCFRIVPPTETRALPAERKGNYETEFGSFDVAFNSAFELSEVEDPVRQFDFPRNMNLAYRIKTYNDAAGRSYRIFASRSSKSEERAGTYDTCVQYLANIPYDEQVNVLLITNNQYTNYQFVPFAVALLKSNHDNVNFDIIGCSDDNHLATAVKYNTNQYYGDIRSILQWYLIFKKEFLS